MENVVASDTHHLVTRSVCTTSARNIQDDFLHSTGISVQENARNALLPLRVEGEVVGIEKYITKENFLIILIAARGQILIKH